MILDENGDNYQVSDDRGRLDHAMIHSFIAKESYWARSVPLPVLERAIANSLVFGVYHCISAISGQEISTQGPDQQVGFARVVTDYATFAFLADVFILPAHRGLGLGKRLVAAVMAHPELQGLRRWILATQDAHDLYERFGFTFLARPDTLMERHDPEVYLPHNTEPNEQRESAA